MSVLNTIQHIFTRIYKSNSSMKNRFLRRLTKRRSRDPASDSQFNHSPRVLRRSIVLRLYVGTFVDVYEFYVIFIRYEYTTRWATEVPCESRVRRSTLVSTLKTKKQKKFRNSRQKD